MTLSDISWPRPGPAVPPMVRRAVRWGSLAFALMWTSCLLFVRGWADDSESVPFHVGFSRQLFTEVNVNDARASVKAWAQALVRERGIPADPDATVFDTVAAMEAAFVAGKLDSLALRIDEYALLRAKVRFDPILFAAQNHRTNVEYLVLAHQDSGIANLRQLSGRKLSGYDNPRMSLALPWLDLELTSQGLRPTSQWVGHLSFAKKVSSVVLPVFFRQMDACLIDRGSFETMSELNPQVGLRLKAIATSPALVPMLFCIRAEYSTAMKARIIPALVDLNRTPTGQQVLTVFQMERLVLGSPAALESALTLLAAHRLQCPETNHTTSVAADSRSDNRGGTRP